MGLLVFSVVFLLFLGKFFISFVFIGYCKIFLIVDSIRGLKRVGYFSFAILLLSDINKI